MGRPTVQTNFTRQNCESEAFAPFFCMIIHRMVADPKESDVESDNWITLLQKTDGHFISGWLETEDPDNVVAVIEHADMQGEYLGCTRIPVRFADVVEGEESIMDLVGEGFEELYTSKAEPQTPVVIVTEDSQCGWIQAGRWAESHGAIILWWSMIADQWLNWSNEAKAPQTGIDFWERGRKIGFRHGFSEGFYQATKEMEGPKKKEVENGTGLED